MFRTNGTNWFVSESGSGRWQQINTSRVRLPDLAFGDFIGDGKTDVFRVGPRQAFERLAAARR